MSWFLVGDDLAGVFVGRSSIKVESRRWLGGGILVIWIVETYMCDFCGQMRSVNCVSKLQSLMDRGYNTHVLPQADIIPSILVVGRAHKYGILHMFSKR